MITPQELDALLLTTMPDAQTEWFDKTGMQDHYRLWISSAAFADKNAIQQRQLIYQALDAVLKDGRLHAIEITTDVPQTP